MKKFFIQTKDFEIAHDFSFHLIQAIKYQNWYYNEQQYDYMFEHDEYDEYMNSMIKGRNYIPIGSVEFVLDFYKNHYGIDNIKPINIPEELRRRDYDKDFLKRNVFYSHINDLYEGNHPVPMFIKSMDKIKGFTDIVKSKNEITEGNYMISDVIDNIYSEWRGFVYDKKLLDLRCYSGEFDIFPDIKLVWDMIREYKNSPKAYTIDIGVNEKGTFLIEIHQFFSCGLYGFADYRVLPQMFISCHNEILNKNNILKPN